jgi:adenylate cyclase
MPLRLSPAVRRNILRIIPFGVIWFLMAQVFLVSDWAAIGDVANTPDSAIELTFGIYLFATALIVIIGLIVGAMELLFLNALLARFSLSAKLFLKTGFYAGFLLLVILVTFPMAAALEMGTSVVDPAVRARLAEFLFSRTAAGTLIQLVASLVASLFYAEISEHMGPGVLRNFLTGRYHAPREERRIFLFTDMKDSTAIAERLGHHQYFLLLKAYYNVLSDAIVRHGGAVYQYIGDEIVVSWTEESGLRQGACIEAVLQMKADLEERHSWFDRQFGVRPSFRAGMQLGEVVVGEIGALKKEIVFTGDILNQTSRIQQATKQHETDVLIGDHLASALFQNNPEWSNRLTSIGRQQLRGKQNEVELFKVM